MTKSKKFKSTISPKGGGLRQTQDYAQGQNLNEHSPPQNNIHARGEINL